MSTLTWRNMVDGIKGNQPHALGIEGQLTVGRIAYLKIEFDHGFTGSFK